jgi:hypothetical protein
MQQYLMEAFLIKQFYLNILWAKSWSDFLQTCHSCAPGKDAKATFNPLSLNV